MSRAIWGIDCVHDVPPEQAVKPVLVGGPMTPLRMIGGHDRTYDLRCGNREPPFRETSLNEREHFSFDRSHGKWCTNVLPSRGRRAARATLDRK